MPSPKKNAPFIVNFSVALIIISLCKYKLYVERINVRILNNPQRLEKYPMHSKNIVGLSCTSKLTQHPVDFNLELTALEDTQ